jgi:hypothetical protein
MKRAFAHDGLTCLAVLMTLWLGACSADHAQHGATSAPTRLTVPDTGDVARGDGDAPIADAAEAGRFTIDDLHFRVPEGFVLGYVDSESRPGGSREATLRSREADTFFKYPWEETQLISLQLIDATAGLSALFDETWDPSVGQTGVMIGGRECLRLLESPVPYGAEIYSYFVKLEDGRVVWLSAGKPKGWEQAAKANALTPVQIAMESVIASLWK